MDPYRPISPTPLVLDAGTWAATGRPDRAVTVTLDPRLLTWIVNQASHRGDLTYQIKLGTPVLTVELA